MTTEEARALYDRAVKAGFVMEPGCIVRRGDGPTEVVLFATNAMVAIGSDQVGDDGLSDICVEVVEPADVWCDFREAPSLGAQLGQVRKAWGDPSATPYPPRLGGCAGWSFVANGILVDDLAITEIHSLVYALEAAPRRDVPT